MPQADPTAPSPKAADLLLPRGMKRLGLGTGDLFGGGSLAQSMRLIETALECGIRYFDTARMYGDGSAETVLGCVLPRIRDQVVIASKAGILPYRMLRRERLVARIRKVARLAGPLARALVDAPAPAGLRFGAFSSAELARSVHSSLKELRTDHLDILLLHGCSVADAHRDEVMSFLDGLARAGKVRAFGIATNFPQTCRIIAEVPRLGGVVQFENDALNDNVTRLTGGPRRLVVTHTAIKSALPRLLERLSGDAAAAARWEEVTGVAARDRDGIGRVLLAQALRQNRDGIVLFSSLRPERVRETARIESACESLAPLLREIGMSVRD